MEHLIAHLNDKNFAAHPCLEQIAGRGILAGEGLRDLLVNARGFSFGQRRWYALLVARTEDVRIQSLLAKQLNDELGAGDFSRIHIYHYDSLIETLGKTSPSGPGLRLEAAAETHYSAANSDEALGTVIAAEIRALQFNQWVSTLMGRHNSSSIPASAWHDEHSDTEPDHADEAAQMFQLLSTPERRSSAAKGALALDAALDTFLDEMLEGFRSSIDPAGAVT